MDRCTRVSGLIAGLCITGMGFGCVSNPRFARNDLPGPAIRPLSQVSAQSGVAAPQARSGGESTPLLARFDVPLGPPAEATNSLQSSSSLSSSEDTGAIQLQNVYSQAAARYASIDSYIVRLRRREQVNGKDRPEEILLMKFRKEPWSVYFKWLGSEAKGREVVYVRGGYDDKIYTLLAAGDMPLMPAGKRIALPHDNPLVRSSSRHSIREAGVGELIHKFGNLVQAMDKAENRQCTLKYLGLVRRPEFESPGETVEQLIPAGSEALLPRGGRRLWFFDSATKLPSLVITQDETGREVEYYCYDRYQFPVRLDDDDFNPDKLWSQKSFVRR
jgi:hypothetical protein